MDATRFDALVASLSRLDTRRGLLRVLVGLPLFGVLGTLQDDDEAIAQGRRRRRKKPHHHRKHTGNIKQKGRGQHKKQKQTCRAEPKATTCRDTCGTVQNNCRKTVDCGSCDCDPPCGVCERCSDALVCEPCRLCCEDGCCAQASAVCHAGSGACCVPDSKAQTCNGACGEVTDNCGLGVDCGSCICAPSCAECYVCDDETGQCIPDSGQEGQDCGEDGQVCQRDGACRCEAESCPRCTTCENDGRCHGCSGCCDGQTCVESCGAGQVCCADQCVSGNCCGDDACRGHAHCANHSCQCDSGFHECQGTCVNDQGTGHCGAGCTPCPSSLCSPATCDGQRCGRDPIAGCCESESDCDDGNVCSTDTCDPENHTCMHTNAPSTTPCGSDGICCGGSCCTAPVHASPICDGVACGFICNAGFHRCGGQCVNDTDVATCGTACTPCPTPANGQATCNGESCGIQCDAGYDACGGGCVPRGSASNCSGSCDACGSHMQCVNGSCVCDTGFANCDGDPATGCEADLNSDGACGACGIQCPSSRSCVEGNCLCPASTCDCAALDGCGDHGCCTDTCGCVCDPPYTGAACSELPVVVCPDFTTCTDCRAHALSLGCTWCGQTLGGESNVCVDAVECLIPVEMCL